MLARMILTVRVRRCSGQDEGRITQVYTMWSQWPHRMPFWLSRGPWHPHQRSSECIIPRILHGRTGQGLNKGAIVDMMRFRGSR